jgi:hypothetical protein
MRIVVGLFMPRQYLEKGYNTRKPNRRVGAG